MIQNSMVQFMIFPNCNNNCKFCLRLNRDNWDIETKLKRIEEIKTNIKSLDWSQHPFGVSIMGGELYYETNETVIKEVLNLIDIIIEVVLKPYKTAKLSTVTNGIYDPNVFLFKVFDKVRDSVGIDKADINVSYDIKYRYDTKEREQMAINTINAIHKRYNYNVGVQTILTGYLIDAIGKKKFDIKKFEEKIIPGNQLTLLYPHPINPKLPPLDDFKFTRKQFLNFILWLKENFPRKYENFYLSTHNSAVFKKTGLKDVLEHKETEQPELWDGKQIINKQCNHSTLYQCYKDCDDCMLCDLQQIGRV